MEILNLVWESLVGWLADGLIQTTWWQVLLFAVVVTHITIAAVTIYLHRAQAHRALELHPIPAHFFRLWLWLTTGMVTREWVAIHRKHHAKCETPDDPHSPQTRGIRTVLLRGAELYRSEAKNAETIAKYSQGTPGDWIENHLYSRYSWQGVGLMLIINLMLFGAIGAAVWALQMAWIPITAAGIINGIGHWWGYRNFEAADASTNISPWGIVIGGEELHNNHHTYPTSAKLSVKPGEFDIGWLYIRVLETVGWAKVRKIPPQLKLGAVRSQADGKTLEARVAQMRLARRWLHRDEDKIPLAVKPDLAAAVAQAPRLAKLVAMREELRQLWTRTNVSAEQLVSDLQAWCRKAEDSGIQALQEFSLKLRAAQPA